MFKRLPTKLHDFREIITHWVRQYPSMEQREVTAGALAATNDVLVAIYRSGSSVLPLTRDL